MYLVLLWLQEVSLIFSEKSLMGETIRAQQIIVIPTSIQTEKVISELNFADQKESWMRISGKEAINKAMAGVGRPIK